MKLTLSESNKRTVTLFMNELDRRGLCERRKNKYRILLRKFSHLRLSKITKKEADKFFIELKNSDFTDDTKIDYWYMFRSFMKWKNKRMDLSGYRLKVKIQRKLPEDILTTDEVRSLIVSYKNLKFRALVSLLYDSGCRPAELLNLSVNDVMFDSDGMVCILNGKTGTRRIRIITTMDSDKFLREYMSISNIPVGKIFGHMTIERLNQIVKEQAQKLGTTKRVYSYLFRHTRATHLAPHLTEQQLKIYLGWSMSSKMAAVYVHMSGKDLDSKVMELNNNPVAFIPSEGFKEFMYQRHRKRHQKKQEE